MSKQHATPSAATGAAKNRASAAAEVPSKTHLKAGLRGKDLATQTQMLHPPAAAAGKASAKPSTKAPTKAPGAAKGARGPAEEGDSKQLILDQMGREWRAGETAAYEELKANYEKLYGPLPDEAGEPAVDEDQQQMQQLLGSYWRNGELKEFEALKKVYEKSYGPY